jgi:hypothetical protein
MGILMIAFETRMIVCENTWMFALEIGMIESEMRMTGFECETEVVGSCVVALEMKMCMFEMRMIGFECGKEVVAFRIKTLVLGTEALVAEINTDLIGMRMIAFEIKMIALEMEVVGFECKMRMFGLGMFVFGMKVVEIGMKEKSTLRSRDPLTLPRLSSTHHQRIASTVHPFPLQILQQCAVVEMVHQNGQLSSLSEKDSQYAC